MAFFFPAAEDKEEISQHSKLSDGDGEVGTFTPPIGPGAADLCSCYRGESQVETKRRHEVAAGLMLIKGMSEGAASSCLSGQHQVPPVHPSHRQNHTHTSQRTWAAARSGADTGPERRDRRRLGFLPDACLCFPQAALFQGRSWKITRFLPG